MVLKQLSKIAEKIKLTYSVYQKRLEEIHKIEVSLVHEISKYYNRECVYRQAMDSICKNMLKGSRAIKNMGNFFDKNIALINSFDEIYTRIPKLFGDYLTKRKKFEHYTQKLRSLKDERRHYEDENKVYTSKKMQRLLRNEKKLYNAKLDLEKHEGVFDEKTDDVFTGRFKSINKLLYKQIKFSCKQYAEQSAAYNEILETSKSLLKMDDFSKYKAGSFGTVSQDSLRELEDKNDFLIAFSGQGTIMKNEAQEQKEDDFFGVFGANKTELDSPEGFGSPEKQKKVDISDDSSDLLFFDMQPTPQNGNSGFGQSNFKKQDSASGNFYSMPQPQNNQPSSDLLFDFTAPPQGGSSTVGPKSKDKGNFDEFDFADFSNLSAPKKPGSKANPNADDGFDSFADLLG